MSDASVFVVPIHDLDAEGRDFRAPIEKVWLDEILKGCELQPSGADGRLDVHLSKMGNDVFVKGKIDVDLVVPCARCLAAVPMRCGLDLTLLLSPAAPPPMPKARGRAPHRGPKDRARPEPAQQADEVEFSAEEADQDTYEGDEVVLDRFVREAVLLESPIFPLCSDACKGIRPSPEPPEANQGGVDPRFLPLLELAKKRNSKE